jgi:carboxymethylenebutenolidase
MFTTSTESVAVADGQFDLHLWIPQSGQGPAVLLIQEIFGVGPYIRAVAERLVAMGYVVGAPDVFWRIQPGFTAAHSPEGLESAIGMVPKFDFGKGVTDCIDALGVLAARPETTGVPGVIGFCLGGGLGWFVAARAEPSCAVLYYGSAITAGLGEVDAITCPTLLHWGDKDAYIPAPTLATIEAAIAGHDNITSRTWSAGHAFDNHEAPMFWNADAAAAAWAVTDQFLRTHLG